MACRSWSTSARARSTRRGRSRSSARAGSTSTSRSTTRAASTGCRPSTSNRHSVRFEKWQALGNDYVIVEAAELPAPLTPSAVRALCDRHTGIGADGILLLQPPDADGFVARLRIFNPDGSEAELSGNGAREAIMYLRRRGWTDRDEFAILTVAGEIRPTILSETTCRVDMGHARDGGIGEVESGGRTWRFRNVSIGNPQCAIAVGSVAELQALDLPAIGPAIEHSPL